MQKTKIEYLTHTWNPLAMRCTPVSEGCANCWHLRMADRLAKNPTLGEWEREAYAGGEPVLLEDRLKDPLLRKKPSVIGVQFMGDIFHDNTSTHHINSIFRIIQSCSQDRFVVLTKRPERMRDYMMAALRARSWPEDDVPFQNVWLGVTVENQQRADERIPFLLQTPAAVRFVSVEPMLGPVELMEKGYLSDHEWETGTPGGLNWVICGGETGPGARPMHPDWVRGLRDQCRSVELPFYFKSWGEWSLKGDVYLQHRAVNNFGVLSPDGVFFDGHTGWNGRPIDPDTNEAYMLKIGKKNAGHLIDGQEWRQMPGEL